MGFFNFLSLLLSVVVLYPEFLEKTRFNVFTRLFLFFSSSFSFSRQLDKQIPERIPDIHKNTRTCARMDSLICQPSKRSWRFRSLSQHPHVRGSLFASSSACSSLAPLKDACNTRVLACTGGEKNAPEKRHFYRQTSAESFLFIDHMLEVMSITFGFQAQHLTRPVRINSTGYIVGVLMVFLSRGETFIQSDSANVGAVVLPALGVYISI